MVGPLAPETMIEVPKAPNQSFIPEEQEQQHPQPLAGSFQNWRYHPQTHPQYHQPNEEKATVGPFSRVRQTEIPVSAAVLGPWETRRPTHPTTPGPALRPVSTVALARGDVEVFGNEYSPSLVTPLPPLWSSSIGSPSPDDDGYDCYAGSSVQGGAASSAATPGERYVQSLASGHWFVDDGISALEDPSFLDDLSMYMEEKEEEEERGLAVPNSKLSQP